MPTYEYQCEDGHEFEFDQRITDPPLEYCLCADDEGNFCQAFAKRLISATHFQLNGGGWTGPGR